MTSLSAIQEEIIKEACLLQQESFDRIATQIFEENEQDSLYLFLLEQHGVSLETYIKELTSCKRRIGEIIEIPERVFELKDLDISLFRHVLFNCMDKWRKTHPVALKGIWRKLFLKEDFDKLDNFDKLDTNYNN